MDDVSELLRIFSDPIAMRHYPSTKDRDETEAWIRWQLESYRRHGFGLWAAILRESELFAGQCGLVVQEVEGRREIEIGYLFVREHWGQGLATEAARACRDWGFRGPGFARLVSLIDPENLASRRVAEKVGMKMERTVRKWGKTVCVYTIENPGDGRGRSSG